MTDLCKSKVWRGYHSYPCTNKATRGEYCGVHDLDRVAARNARQTAKWDAEVREMKAKAAKLAAHDDLVAALEACLAVISGEDMNRMSLEKGLRLAHAALAKAKGEA